MVETIFRKASNASNYKTDQPQSRYECTQFFSLMISTPTLLWRSWVKMNVGWKKEDSTVEYGGQLTVTKDWGAYLGRTCWKTPIWKQWTNAAVSNDFVSKQNFVQNIFWSTLSLPFLTGDLSKPKSLSAFIIQQKALSSEIISTWRCPWLFRNLTMVQLGCGKVSLTSQLTSLASEIVILCFECTSKWNLPQTYTT